MDKLIISIFFLLPVYMVRFSIFGIPTTALEILIYLALIITLLNGKHHPVGDENRLKKPFCILVFAFCISAIIGVIVSPDKQVASGQFKGFIVDPLIFVYILWKNGFLSDNKKQQKLLKAYILSAAILSIHTIWQKISGTVTADNRVLGVFAFELYASPNFLAYYIAPAGALALNQNLKFKIIYFLIIFAALIFAGSRGAILALLASGFIMFWIWLLRKYSGKKLLINLLFIILAFNFLLLTFYLFKPDLSASPGEGRVTTSSNIRYMIWQTTGKIIWENPKNFVFGIGLGNYQNYFTSFTKTWANYPEYIAPMAVTPHNIFLSVWLQGGLLMLFSFIGLIYLAIKNSYKNKKYQILAALLVILFIGLVDTPLWKNDWTIIFWTILALAV